VIEIDRNPYNRDYKKRREKKPKTARERRNTHIEVQQIKRDLINYANTEWGKKWVKSVLKFGRPFRMKRGINYAEEERRISNISINKGEIFATVQGTAPSPYRVRIEFKVIPEDKWDDIVTEISKNLLFIIYLLEGKLPQEINNIFKRNEASLFPDALKGFNAKCSCPDKEVPCKHIAAIVLYIARVIDYNPFILLEVNGITKDEIISKLLPTSKEEEKREKLIKTNQKELDAKFSFNIPPMKIEKLKSTDSNSEDFRVNFQFQKPSKIIETLENLGLPPNLEDDRKFQIVLRKIYEKVTKNTYKLYKSSENS
jgi:uncharacterized Zn finger protein